MKQIKLITLCVLCAFAGLHCFAQIIDGGSKRDDGSKKDENGNKINRTYYPTADGGGVQTATPMANDKINGSHKMYYKSGVLWTETPYINSVPTGIAKMYKEDGMLSSETQWVDGKINLQKLYYPSGQLLTETPFSVDMKINGTQKTYYKSGMLLTENPFVNNKMNGVQKTYSENGKLIKETLFVDSKMNGIVKQYDENGKLLSETPYADNKINGVVKNYDEIGQLKEDTPKQPETTIDDVSMNGSKLNGVKKEYYASGQLKEEVSYTNGKKNEVDKFYFESGGLSADIPYSEGKKNGVAKGYYEKNGKLKVETPYTDGKINGIVKQYDENGKLVSETPYTDNIINGEAKTEEPVYRGGGDPLKGLNVSKPKEIASGNYYALIIGIDKYTGTWKPLNTAVHDAQAFENVLRTKYKIDKFYTLYDAAATRSAIENALDNLVNTMKENDNVVIYYSGHGDFKKTMNKGYWIPVDAKSNATSDLISNNDIQSFLDAIKTKHTLLIADACFSGDIFRGNTLTEPFEESDKYYSKVYNLMSRQALTSGGIEPVMDGGREGHSVFAYYLLKNLTNNTNKYFDVGSLYNKVKIPVVNNSDQTPQLNPIKNTGDEGGQFIFIKK